MDNEAYIYFIREFRYPVNKTILQLPAGTTDKNYSSLSSAKKELWEETRLKAKNWKKIGSFFIGPGHENVQANIFLATKIDASQIDTFKHSEEELIFSSVKLSLAQIKQLIKTNKIQCGITLAALNLFFIKCNK